MTLVAASVAGCRLLPGGGAEKRRITILHTNDMHSNFIGVGPMSDYDPMTTGSDTTIGGYARLAARIDERRRARESLGPVLVLDAGDYSMGTAFGAATRELGAELRLMARMGYDAITLGNHELDFGPDGLAESIAKATEAGPIPPLLAANTELGGDDPRLASLREWVAKDAIRSHTVIERGGLRIGIVGLLGYDASKYVMDPGGLTFTDPVETAMAAARELREEESVDVVIALSHGGVVRAEDGSYTGEDVELLRKVPGIDLVVGGHTHSRMTEPQLVDGRPVVQSGRYGEDLGEIVVSLEAGRVQVESYQVLPIDDEIQGDAAVHQEVGSLLAASSAAVFKPRGYDLTQPLVVIDRDWPMDFADIEGCIPLSNTVTDAFRRATATDVAFTPSGLIRAGLKKGSSGVQTAYDVFSLAPLGFGIVDDTAGSAMVKAYFTGRDLKNILEFFLIEDPVLPGQYFPRVSGMRFTYDPKRPQFDVVQKVELGSLESGYQELDVSESADELYSFSCPLYAGLLLVGIPKLSKGAVQLTAKKADGTRLETRTEALVDPSESTGPYLLSDRATIESGAAVTDGPKEEIKEWQAIMDYLVALPEKNADGVSLLKLDARAKEVRAVRT